MNVNRSSSWQGAHQLARVGRRSTQDADDGADDGSPEQDGQQHLPAQPGAQRSQQFEVAAPHAFLAGGELEQPVHAPKREVADDGADDRAKRMGYKLSEYGLFKGEKVIASKTEEEIYETLGLAWIPPELRESTGEIEAAEEGNHGDA